MAQDVLWAGTRPHAVATDECLSTAAPHLPWSRTASPVGTVVLQHPPELRLFVALPQHLAAGLLGSGVRGESPQRPEEHSHHVSVVQQL